jgi:hypothetical protein
MEHIIVLFISLEKWNENEVNVAILDMVWNIMHLATLGMVWKWSLVSSHTTQIATQTVFTFFIFINSKANRNISLSLLLVFFSKVAIHHKTMAIQSQSPLLLSWFLTPSLVASLVLAWVSLRSCHWPLTHTSHPLSNRTTNGSLKIQHHTFATPYFSLKNDIFDTTLAKISIKHLHWICED